MSRQAWLDKIGCEMNGSQRRRPPTINNNTIWRNLLRNVTELSVIKNFDNFKKLSVHIGPISWFVKNNTRTCAFRGGHVPMGTVVVGLSLKN